MWLVIVAVVLVAWAVMAYNGLVRLRERSDGAWADIDVQLKRRYDLIPNLVETVKGYAGHEKETLEGVIAARNQAMSAGGVAEQAKAENMLTGALKSLFALSEAYPQLQAAGGFQQLQGQLTEIETQISQARRYYNAVVRDYNAKTKTVPTNMIAGSFGFREREYFELDDDVQREAPQVDFGS